MCNFINDMGKSAGRYLLYSVAFVMAACSQQNYLGGTLKLNSLMCVANNSLHSNLRASDLKIACQNPGNYVCSAKIFGPTLSDGKLVTNQCSSIAALNKPCLNVAVQNFSTGSLLKVSSVDPKKFAAGGDFNRSEFSCYNSSAGIDASKILGESSTLDNALLSAYTSCLNLKATGGGSAL